MCPSVEVWWSILWSSHRVEDRIAIKKYEMAFYVKTSKIGKNFKVQSNLYNMILFTKNMRLL